MQKYIALLRGINISGKNKVAMSELKASFEELGFCEVKTYLNNGNVVFSCEEEDALQIALRISSMILRCFGIDVLVYVILQQELAQILQESPAWWGKGDKTFYDNLIIVIQPMTTSELAEKIGEPTTGLEQISIKEKVIFWTFDRAKYAKAKWWKKTASEGIGEWVTIRTANTLTKIVKI